MVALDLGEDDLLLIYRAPERIALVVERIHHDWNIGRVLKLSKAKEKGGPEGPPMQMMV